MSGGELNATQLHLGTVSMLPVDPDHVKLPPKNLSQLRCTKLQLAAWADYRPYAEQSQLVPTNPSGG